MTIRGRRALLLAILLGIASFSLFALSVGSADIPSVWRYIFNSDLQGNAHEIIWNIRAPRILVALLIGLALGVAGALSQSATNNPLADPSIIGTSAGASLGAVIALLLNISTVGSFPVVIFAVIGALVVSLATFALSKSALQLVIIGIATSALISSVVGLLISISDRADARSIAFWSLGSLALVSKGSVGPLALLILPTAIAGWYFSQSLDLLALGDRGVQHLGVKPQKLRLVAFIFISILIATSVSTVGSIAFLALAAPHITRFLIGPTNRPLVIGSGVIGAGILLLADTAARSLVPPFELPIGLITSLVGAPILILILRKSGEVWR